MKLKLVPHTLTNESLISELFVDGIFECHILEDIPRDEKVFGKTCIPEGIYKVIITRSPRFNMLLPLLCDVPGYVGVRIHPGNTAADTEGCLLPGLKSVNSVTNSRIAFSKLFTKIQNAININQQVHIEILRPLKKALA